MAQVYELITSRQNSLMVETHKLSDRKHRVKSGLFRFDGVKLASEAILRSMELTSVLLRQSDVDRVSSRIFDLTGKTFPSSARVVAVADHVFDSLSEEDAPEGIICVSRMPREVHRNWQEGMDIPGIHERVMLLESVRDPSNLGAIIRSAAALGVDRLILTTDCADIYSAKTARASMGTLFSQRIDRTEDICAYIDCLKLSGRRVFAAALDAEACCLGSFDALPGDCAVIGNEGHGLSAKVIDVCERKVYIPMTPHAESLNAAVAAALLMWEFGQSVD